MSAPMSPAMLRSLVGRALHWIDWALTDAEGHRNEPPYNLVTPGGTVLDELLVVAEGLAWIVGALSPPSSPAPPG